jgi:hypothetical protein
MINEEINTLPKQEIDEVIKVSYDTDVKKAINYIEYALTKKCKNTILICGLNLAISKVILIAEIVKTRIKNLHQINKIDCLISNDKFDDSLEKRVPKLEIILTTKEPINKGMGYQNPISEDDYKKLELMEKEVANFYEDKDIYSEQDLVFKESD